MKPEESISCFLNLPLIKTIRKLTLFHRQNREIYTNIVFCRLRDCRIGHLLACMTVPDLCIYCKVCLSLCVCVHTHTGGGALIQVEKHNKKKTMLTFFGIISSKHFSSLMKEASVLLLSPQSCLKFIQKLCLETTALSFIYCRERSPVCLLAFSLSGKQRYSYHFVAFAHVS